MVLTLIACSSALGTAVTSVLDPLPEQAAITAATDERTRILKMIFFIYLRYYFISKKQVRR